ncbi:MAG: hypothetical protein Q9163_002825 [Psora crenata]
MVSLGVAERLPSHLKRSIMQSKSLRDAALWYPDIPEPGLHLNDDCFTGEDPSARYRPLHWTLFGGPGGIYLRSLTNISVTFKLCWGGAYLRGIEFHYNTDEVPAELRKLGRYRPTGDDRVVRFPIDGPGGEIIETVEVYVDMQGLHDEDNPFKRQLISLKASLRDISTNRGGSFHFRNSKNEFNKHLMLKPMVIAPGTTLTGFYVSQEPQTGFVGFGVEVTQKRGLDIKAD